MLLWITHGFFRLPIQQTLGGWAKQTQHLELSLIRAPFFNGNMETFSDIKKDLARMFSLTYSPTPKKENHGLWSLSLLRIFFAVLGKQFKESLALMQEKLWWSCEYDECIFMYIMNALESRNSASSYITSNSPWTYQCSSNCPNNGANRWVKLNLDLVLFLVFLEPEKNKTLIRKNRSILRIIDEPFWL